MRNNNFNDYPIDRPNEAHLPVLLLLDVSGSMFEHDAIKKVELAVNRFVDDICKDPNAEELVDICVVTFSGSPKVVHDWSGIREFKGITLTAAGGTNMSDALSFANEKIKERNGFYEDRGMEVRKPYLIILTDGKGNDIDSIAAEIRQRTADKKMLPWFMGVNEYDKETAAKITGGERVFELVDEIGYDFTDFFRVLEVSIKAASATSPGARVVIKDEENPLLEENCNLKVPDLNAWLNG